MPDDAGDEPAPTPAPNVVSAPAPPAEPEHGFDASADAAVTGREPEEAAAQSDGGAPEAAARAPEAPNVDGEAAEPATSDEAQAAAAPEPSSKRSSSGRRLALGALCAVALVGAWMVFGRDRSFATRTTSGAETTQRSEARSESAPAARGSFASTQPTPAPRSASLQASSSSTPKVAEQQAAPEAASVTTAVPSAQPAEESNAGTISVRLDVRPVGSQVYHKGRYVGKAPLLIELERGEKRAFEVNKPGYAPQKVVLDGRKTNVLIGLRRQAHP